MGGYEGKRRKGEIYGQTGLKDCFKEAGLSISTVPGLGPERQW